MHPNDTVAPRPRQTFPAPPAAVITVADTVSPTPPTDRLAFVDVLRGLAILAVIAVHARYTFPDLPQAVLFFGALGRFGVDLFFIVSAFTLFRSNRDFSLRTFLLRRWLRIAPVYYLGIVLYAGLLRATASGSDAGIGAILANLVFLNAWIPGGGNDVVPGGWSISTEVAFYALLPVALAFVTTLRRAVITFVVTLIASTILLDVIARGLAGHWTGDEIGEFRSYCPIGHMATFCLGVVLYHLLPRLRAALPEAKQRLAAIGLMAAGLLLLALLNSGDLREFMPRSAAAGLPLFLFSAGMALASKFHTPVIIASPGNKASKPGLRETANELHTSHRKERSDVATQLDGLPPRRAPRSDSLKAVSRAVATKCEISRLDLRRPPSTLTAALRWLGVVSYGVYLVHFFVLDLVAQFVVGILPAGAPGLALFLTTFVLTVALSAAGAAVVHCAIELPALRLGTRQRPAVA